MHALNLHLMTKKLDNQAKYGNTSLYGGIIAIEQNIKFWLHSVEDIKYFQLWTYLRSVGVDGTVSPFCFSCSVEEGPRDPDLGLWAAGRSPESPLVWFLGLVSDFLFIVENELLRWRPFVWEDWPGVELEAVVGLCLFGRESDLKKSNTYIYT